MIELDYKVTIWRRAGIDTSKVDENTVDKFKAAIKKGHSIDDIYNKLGDYISTDVFIDDTEELLTVKEDWDNSTIELLIDGNVVITNFPKNKY